jgi:hypothetical protein
MKFMGNPFGAELEESLKMAEMQELTLPTVGRDPFSDFADIVFVEFLGRDQCESHRLGDV